MSTDQKTTWASHYYDRALREVLQYRKDLWSPLQRKLLEDLLAGAYVTDPPGLGRAEPPAPASQDGEKADSMVELSAHLRSAVQHRQAVRSALKDLNVRIETLSEHLQLAQGCVEEYERRLLAHVVGEVA